MRALIGHFRFILRMNNLHFPIRSHLHNAKPSTIVYATRDLNLEFVAILLKKIFPDGEIIWNIFSRSTI